MNRPPTHPVGHPLWPSLTAPADQGRDDLCAVSAHGVRVRFADGGELLDGSSGLWNTNIGYGNEEIARACADALREASYLSVFRYENTYARRAAEALIEACGAAHYGRVLFSTSGGAANDLVMKVARQYQALRQQPQRKVVVGLRGSYHGLTYGSFALTGDDLGQQLYAVDQRFVRHVTPNEPAELAALMARQGGQIAAVVVEPVLGSGAVPLTDEYLAELLRLRREHGFLLVADEVATGFGRTGSLFASQEWPEQPDLLVSSKGLTNGTAAAAVVIASRQVAAAFTEAGSVLTHGETQAGTPVTCAAILATLAEMRRLDAVALGRRLSARLDTELAALTAAHPRIAGTTGQGCFRSVRLCDPDGTPFPQEQVHALVQAIREAGAIVHPGVNGVQLIPALTYTDADLDELLARVLAGIELHLARTAAEAAGAAA
ncbi:daptide-type RiPP biosynthesis aminotransferase [Streptomyces sp. NPDC059708]|uniref:daptide-type RiPP biosynthesis aminotransferase n=1 Tax=Streptomyces sp. NPDC059708 TaxID=3346916 RepID=UPI003687D4FA